MTKMQYVLLVFGETTTPAEFRRRANVTVRLRPGWSAVSLSGDGAAVSLEPTGLAGVHDLASIHVVECRDIDQAVAMAGPLALAGRVEIRPVDPDV